jgi:nitrogen regulatory protein P-II 2
MKMILAYLRPHKLDEVRSALTGIGVEGMTVVEAQGHGRQKGHTEVYRGAEYAVSFVPKIRLETVVSDDLADAVVETLLATAGTGKIGDGKVFVLDVAQAHRIRTRETGDLAL